MSVLLKVRSHIQCNSYKNSKGMFCRNRKPVIKCRWHLGMLNGQNSVLWAPLLKILRPFVEGLFLAPLFCIRFICLSLFQCHPFAYGCFVISFETRKCEPSTWFFCFKSVLHLVCYTHKQMHGCS